MSGSTRVLPILAIVMAVSLGCAPAATARPTAGDVPVPATPSVRARPVPPTPETGKASISGVLYSYVLSRNIPETVFYLTRPAVQEDGTLLGFVTGPRKDLGDLQGVSDKAGYISLNGIQPGDYFLLVWAPYNWVPAESSSETHSARLIRLVAGQAEDLGTVFVPWP